MAMMMIMMMLQVKNGRYGDTDYNIGDQNATSNADAVMM